MAVRKKFGKRHRKKIFKKFSECYGYRIEDAKYWIIDDGVRPRSTTALWNYLVKVHEDILLTEYERDAMPY